MVLVNERSAAGCCVFVIGCILSGLLPGGGLIISKGQAGRERPGAKPEWDVCVSRVLERFQFFNVCPTILNAAIPYLSPL
jgi:hypothetical protein